VARILVGTNDGLHVFGPDGRRSGSELLGRQISALAPQGSELWAILDHAEVWHAAGIDLWFHVGTLEGLEGECLADTRAGVIVGSSEARLFRVVGEGLEPVLAFDQAEGRPDWFTPWGGPPAVRSISEDDEAAYVNVHVGGILRSRDRGDSWQATIDMSSDVHQVCTSPGRVLAACARGLAVSLDQGSSWAVRSEGLHATYCRSVAVCGSWVMLSASTGPRGSQSALYRGHLDGDALERCVEGLPAWFDENIDTHCLDALPEGDVAAFGSPDGRVFASTDQGAQWAEVASGLPSVNCLRVLP
jgi:hypothetical protein